MTLRLCANLAAANWFTAFEDGGPPPLPMLNCGANEEKFIFWYWKGQRKRFIVNVDAGKGNGDRFF